MVLDSSRCKIPKYFSLASDNILLARYMERWNTSVLLTQSLCMEHMRMNYNSERHMYEYLNNCFDLFSRTHKVNRLCIIRI